MSGLDWKLGVNGLAAVGRHGKYRIERNFQGEHVLHGVGHDGLLMLALPPNGRAFVTRMSTIVREAAAVVELVQQLDPTPVGLVRASKVTDINSKRR